MNDNIEAQIEIVEEKLRLAMIAADVNTLDELIAPELIFTDHLGNLVSKQADLDGHKSGAFKITSIEPSDRHILVKNTVAIVSVKIHLAGSYRGTPTSGTFRFTRVWAQSDAGTWQIIAGHSGIID